MPGVRCESEHGAYLGPPTSSLGPPSPRQVNPRRLPGQLCPGSNAGQQRAKALCPGGPGAPRAREAGAASGRRPRSRVFTNRCPPRAAGGPARARAAPQTLAWQPHPRFSAHAGCGVRAPPPGSRSREPAAWEPAPPSLRHDARPWLLRLPRSLKAESPAHALSDTGVRDPVHTTTPAGKGCPRVPAIRGGAGRPEGAAEPPRCVRVTAEQSFDLPALPALPLRQARPRP